MHARGHNYRRVATAFGVSSAWVREVVGIRTSKRSPRPRKKGAVKKGMTALSPAKPPSLQLTPAQQTRRAATIEYLWRQGVSQLRLARRFMITRERVRQIIRDRLKARGESLAHAKAGRPPRLPREPGRR